MSKVIRKLKTSNEEIETEIAQLVKQRQNIALQIKKLRNRLNARNFKSKQTVKKDQETVDVQNDKSSEEEDQNDL
jgi:regulator of replication initiation timing